MSTAAETGFLLFVPSPQGYRVEERTGEPPAQGDAIEANGGQFVVSRLGPSPFPLDSRRCAYLLSIVR